LGSSAGAQLAKSMVIKTKMKKISLRFFLFIALPPKFYQNGLKELRHLGCLAQPNLNQAGSCVRVRSCGDAHPS
jgi:hypothetical protein